MIALQAPSGRFLEISPEQSIDIVIECDLFNPEQIEGTRTYSFSLPMSQVNKQELGHAQHIERKEDGLKTYPGFTLYIRQVPFRTGNFVLEKTNERYEGYFQTDVGIVSQFKNKRLVDIIDFEETLPGTDLADLAGYTDLENDIVFPMHYRGADVTINRYTSGAFSNPVSPAIKVTRVITEALKNINFANAFTKELASGSVYGYSIPAFAAQLLRLCFYPQRNITETNGRKTRFDDLPATPLPASFNIKDHVPDITFGDILRDLFFMFGFVPRFKTTRKLFSFTFLRSILNNPSYKEISLQTFPRIDQEKNTYQGLSFSWVYEDENYLREQPENLDEYFLADAVDQIADLPAATAANEFEVRLVRLQNEYYYVERDEVANTYSWQFLAAGVMPYQEGESPAQVLPVLAPALKRDYYWKQYNVENVRPGYLRDNGSGFVRVEFGRQNQASALNGLTLQFVNSSTYDNETPYTITAVGNATPRSFVDIDLAYIANEDQIDFEIRIEIEFIPVSTDGRRYVFYHGLQNRKSGSDPYPYASPDHILPDATEVPDGFALRWNGTDGLIGNFWREPLNFLANTRKAVAEVQFNLLQLLEFDPTEKLRIRDNNFLPYRVRTVVNPDGSLQASKVDLRLVPASTFIDRDEVSFVPPPQVIGCFQQVADGEFNAPTAIADNNIFILNDVDTHIQLTRETSTQFGNTLRVARTDTANTQIGFRVEDLFPLVAEVTVSFRIRMLIENQVGVFFMALFDSTNQELPGSRVYITLTSDQLFVNWHNTYTIDQANEYTLKVFGQVLFTIESESFTYTGALFEISDLSGCYPGSLELICTGFGADSVSIFFDFATDIDLVVQAGPRTYLDYNSDVSYSHFFQTVDMVDEYYMIITADGPCSALGFEIEDFFCKEGTWRVNLQIYVSKQNLVPGTVWRAEMIIFGETGIVQRQMVSSNSFNTWANGATTNNFFYDKRHGDMAIYITISEDGVNWFDPFEAGDFARVRVLSKQEQ